MNKTKTALLVLAGLLFAAPCLARYDFTVVNYPGAAQTVLFAVNDRGQFVGAFFDAAKAPHAMYFDGERLAPLDPDGVVGQSPRSRAYSINNWDAIAGSYSDAGGTLHGYVLRHGVVTPVEYPGGYPTEAYGINDWGRVIGVYYTADGNPHAFVLDGGGYRQADVAGAVTTVPLSINDRGEIVGEVVDVDGTVGHGYLSHPDGTITRYDAPGAPADSTYFISINNRDQVLGGYFDGAGKFNNFLLQHGDLVPFDLPSSFHASSVSAQTLNDRDEIVGFFTDAEGVRHGFIARDGHGW